MIPDRTDTLTWPVRLLWLMVCLCAAYVAQRMLLQERFGFHDWYLFIGHAQEFVDHGQLYDRDLTHYAPAAAVYKFPPLFAALLVLLLKAGLDAHTIKLLALVGHLACYFTSAALCIALFRPANSRWFAPLAWMLVLTFEPLFDNYDNAQMEMYLLVLCCLALRYHDSQRDFAAGICIGIAAVIKIYPLYLGGYYLAMRNYRALGGMVVGIALILACSLTITGIDEHLFYATQVLPTLLTEDIGMRGDNLSLTRLLVTLGVSRPVAMAMCSTLLLAPLALLACVRRLREADHAMLFCFFTALLLLAMKNSWWNYQLLLLPGFVLALARTVALPEKRVISRVLLSLALALAWFVIFWCNLGKLETLILPATRILDVSPLLTSIMLQTGFLRGFGTFTILLILLYLLGRHVRDA